MTRKRTGSMSMVRSALISSYTVIEPSSAAIAEPARPARRKAIITGPSSFAIARPTIGPSGPGDRGTRAIASTAMVAAPREVPGGDQPLPLARDEPPADVPGPGAARLGVPPVEAVERRPHREHAAILRHQAIEDGRHLPEPPPVRLDAPTDREESREPLAMSRRLVRLPLAPPQDQNGVVALVVEVLLVLAADAIDGPGVEARREGSA